jgi:5-formyltetrahydrofolate cyclo-ligase
MSDLLAHDKRELRERMGERRRRVPPEQAQRSGQQAARLLRTAAEVAEASRVVLYAALVDEIPTQPCFEVLMASGKPCLFPRMRGRELEFCRVESWEELLPGRYGVREPPPGAPASRLGVDDLVLVPGVAFDGHGNRLGRGGGSYDAAFPPGRASAPRLFGLAYAFQLVPYVPHDSRDRRVDAIVTEREIHRVEGRPG